MTNHTASKCKCYFCDFTGRFDNVKRHMRTTHANEVPVGHRVCPHNPKIYMRETTETIRDGPTGQMIDSIRFPEGICMGCYKVISNVRVDGAKKVTDATNAAFRDHQCRGKQQRTVREVIENDVEASPEATPNAAPKAAPKAAAKKQADSDDVEAAIAEDNLNLYDEIIRAIDASDLPEKQRNNFVTMLECNKVEDDDGGADYRSAIKGFIMDLISR